MIGYIGLVLPLLLIVLAVWRDGVAQWKNLDSISAYYYSGAVTAFVGMLIALSLFLYTYRGYKNKHSWADRLVSIVAATAALGVALFPTEAPLGTPVLAWWLPVTGVIHYVSAITLFTMFAVFALLLFPLTAKSEKVSKEKKRRNLIYRVCGVLILGSMIWAGVNGHGDRSIFWPESLALAAFALSWLVKGYAHVSIANAVRNVIGRA